ncbi:unnamed protein product [Nippostrongylus brasiliensis]|uniref:Reverse transcriptase domain-containing protein n=1 Tax=Nippostrongylus brasiliensis TaxID=27835 RepID=A0A0N4YAZ1_NIPBR|nr:unnamed protein product [Nippostrongylus brasiliensis]
MLSRLPVSYSRYIDNCFIICSSMEEMDVCFDIIGRQSEHIKSTQETPKDGWLPFLNVQIQLKGANKITKWYRKPSSKNILVHSKSAHPAWTKAAVIGNMFRPARAVSTGEKEREESLTLAQEIAAKNGYTISDCQRKHISKTFPAPLQMIRSLSPFL